MNFKTANVNAAISAVSEGITPTSYIVLSTTITLCVSEGNLYLVTNPDDSEVWFSAKVGSISEPFTPVSVDGAQFMKAIACCGETCSISRVDDSLIINNGKGDLKLPILVDDNGNDAFHPFFTPSGTDVVVKNLDELKMVSANASKTMDSIALRHIYTDNDCSFTSDGVNISKGPGITGIPMLITGRMQSFFNKHADTVIKDSGDYFWFVSANDGCEARFTKAFQDFIEQFPLDVLQGEFQQEVEHSVLIDMAAFRNSMGFLGVIADAADDYAVTIAQENPNELILKCKQSVQKIPCESVAGSGPWEVAVDCTAANSKFNQYDGKVQLDVYASQLACVGPVTTSIGLIIDD
jgi:hypothetical protein